jgi:hypothetical protein
MFHSTHLVATLPQGFHMIKRKLLAIAMLVLPTLASANLVTNGDFEAAGTGWTTTPTVGFANVSVYTTCCGASGTYTAAPGAAFFGWGDTTGGTLAQNIATVIGQSYVVTFAHGALIGGTPQTLLAAAIGSAGGTLGSQAASAIGTYDFGSVLSNYSFTFIADSATTRLLFTDTSTRTASVDGILDNVTVNAAAVPVPASLPLLLAGLGLFGFTARRKKLTKLNQ